jgi:hypothetical protein
MNKNYITLLFLLSALITNAQKDVKLNINHKLGTSAFKFNSESKNDLDNKFKYTRFEYYISGISITHDGGQITKAPDVYILVNPTKMDTVLIGNFMITKIESISFSVGVDPKVNNADPSKWPNGHALAPKSPSMHWGWSAGYRFAAIEGMAGAALNQEFQIHALGNKNFFNQLIQTTGNTNGNELLVTLNADYNKAISGINVSAGLIEHSEDYEAAECLRNFQTKVFTNEKGEGSILSVLDNQSASNFKVYPNPSNGQFNLDIGNINLADKAIVKITNIIGETIEQFELNSTNSVLSLDSKGVFFLTININGMLSTQKLIIN